MVQHWYAMGTVRAPMAARVRQARIRAGLSQADLAQTIGVTVRAIVFWEAGDRTPRGVSLRRLAQATNRPLEFFFLDEDEAA